MWYSLCSAATLLSSPQVHIGRQQYPELGISFILAIPTSQIPFCSSSIAASAARKNLFQCAMFPYYFNYESTLVAMRYLPAAHIVITWFYYPVSFTNDFLFIWFFMESNCHELIYISNTNNLDINMYYMFNSEHAAVQTNLHQSHFLLVLPGLTSITAAKRECWFYFTYATKFCLMSKVIHK